MIDLEMDSQSVSYANPSTSENSLTINGVKIQKGGSTKNKISSGIQQGLRKILIDKWLDPQIRYIANNFTKMNISLKWPDLSDIGNLGALVDIFDGKANGKEDTVEGIDANKLPKSSNSQSTLSSLKSYSQLSEGVQSLNDQIANPFEQLASMFKKTNLINIETKRLTVKIPMIYSEDINTYEIQLRQRASTNAEIVEERTVRVDALLGTCFSDKADAIADRFREEIDTIKKDPKNINKLNQINKELTKEF